ncbi:hypothetical protein F2P81_014080 [Scophthalmus maximus]|uniref:Uncharacterized protein n=1 Tax=Scophthalmus maximus TaxID=52904 RepID=A0A6A4SSH7_SCOMX|nr:hypothetical protein F2P81_014080 [Scophthalmus maximus]
MNKGRRQTVGRNAHVKAFGEKKSRMHLQSSSGCCAAMEDLGCQPRRRRARFVCLVLSLFGFAVSPQCQCEVMDMEGEGWHHPQTRTQYLLEAECPSADVTRRRSEHNPNIFFWPLHVRPKMGYVLTANDNKVECPLPPQDPFYCQMCFGRANENLSAMCPQGTARRAFRNKIRTYNRPSVVVELSQTIQHAETLLLHLEMDRSNVNSSSSSSSSNEMEKYSEIRKGLPPALPVKALRLIWRCGPQHGEFKPHL